MNLGAILLSVLLVGHSLFGPKAAPMLEQLLQARGAQSSVTAQIINGAPLRYNWENGARAREVNAREMLGTTSTDILILTEAQPLREQVEWNAPGTYALHYLGLAFQSNPDVRTYLQETWPDGAASPAWRAAIDDDLPVWQGIIDQVNANRPQGAEPMRMIPAGQAMALLYDTIQGGADGLPDMGAFFDDGIHPSALGHYYIALVQYAVVTGENPEGLPRQLFKPWGKPYPAPDQALATRLQRLAWQAVTGEAAPTGQAAATPEAAQPGGAARIGINLTSVSDWSTQQPFLDVMKTARPWILHRPGRWGGGDHGDLEAIDMLDADGWPVARSRDLGIIGTLVLTDIPEVAQSLSGRYRLSFDGQGIVEVSGRARNIRYGRNEVFFDYTPGPGFVDIRIQRSRRGDHVRNITVVKELHRARHDAGELFNPDWIARIDGFDTLRFMDWMKTNNSTQMRWADRPKPGDYTYARKGVPVEVMLRLAQQMQASAWFNIPHRADDDYVRNFATLVRDTLPPDARVHVEYSNELWNRQFEQARWVADAALGRWDQKDTGAQFHGMRAAQIAAIWSDVFAAREDTPELINVIATQTGWLGLEGLILNAPLWAGDADFGGRPPHAHFDAYAVTGYFGGILGSEERAGRVQGWIDDSRQAARASGAALGLAGDALEQHIEAHGYALAFETAAQDLRDGSVSGNSADTLLDLTQRVLPYHAGVAAAHGLDLIAYEAGSHVVGLGARVDDAALTGFFQAFNYSDEMGALYADLIAEWQRAGGGLFTAYADVQRPSKWGSWGTLRYLSDQNPRWDALVRHVSCEVACD